MNSVRSDALPGGGGYGARVGPSWIETLARVTLCALCTVRVDDENFTWNASLIHRLIYIGLLLFFLLLRGRKSRVSSFVSVIGIENGEVKFLILIDDF